MNAKMLVGIILIALGIVSLVWQGISYTKKEEVLNVGPLRATATKKETIPIPPVVGGLCLVAGVVLVAVAWKRS
jgi:uncharacterized membrane protein